MRELRLGEVANDELAEWFGYTNSKSFKNNRKKKLIELENFCDFEDKKNHRGVIIKEILISVYSKQLDDDLVYDAEVRKRENHLTSLSGMARDLIAHDPKYKDVKLDTLVRRLSRAGVRAYGEVNKTEGCFGSRKYVWAIKVDDYGHYRFRTEAEEKIYQEIIKEYSHNRGKDFEREALIDKAVKDNELTAAEALEMMSLYQDFFSNVITPFLEKTGCQLAKATEHEVYESMKEMGILKK